MTKTAPKNGSPLVRNARCVMFLLAASLAVTACAKQPPVRTSVFNTAYTPQHVEMQKQADRASRDNDFRPEWFRGYHRGAFLYLRPRNWFDGGVYRRDFDFD